MAKTYQRIWSPHRESRSVKAWASLLSLREETWIWKRDQSRHKATWWVLDGDIPLDARLLQEQQQRDGLRCILLAAQSPHMPNSNWTWVSTPLQANRVNQWLDAEVAKHIATQQPLPEWDKMALHLTHKPDISPYGANMALVVACSRMQQAWLTYSALIHLGLSPAVLERFLADAYRSGALEVQRMKPQPKTKSKPSDSKDSELDPKPSFLSSISNGRLRWRNSKPSDETA